MDFKEFKKIIAFAKKQGLKSLSLDGLHVEFQEGYLAPQAMRKPKAKAHDVKEPLVKAPDAAPTLDDINRFIYEDGEEHA